MTELSELSDFQKKFPVGALVEVRSSGAFKKAIVFTKGIVDHYGYGRLYVALDSNHEAVCRDGEDNIRLLAMPGESYSTASKPSLVERELQALDQDPTRRRVDEVLRSIFGAAEREKPVAPKVVHVPGDPNHWLMSDGTVVTVGEFLNSRDLEELPPGTQFKVIVSGIYTKTSDNRWRAPWDRGDGRPYELRIVLHEDAKVELVRIGEARQSPVAAAPEHARKVGVTYEAPAAFFDGCRVVGVAAVNRERERGLGGSLAGSIFDP